MIHILLLHYILFIFFFFSFLFLFFIFFFFNDTATTEIYTLSLHDALPISSQAYGFWERPWRRRQRSLTMLSRQDRKSTRLNSSHITISYAVFCLKKKKKKNNKIKNKKKKIKK